MDQFFELFEKVCDTHEYSLNVVSAKFFHPKHFKHYQQPWWNCDPKPKA